ncbi:MAG: siderophore-interacting protein [Nocardioidaceae bacterium]|nr:siderophore-interacting protein [Nocardioidaceae bacterium]NUS53103.1 siderophore-interacting protein [Nocardioidaceae bacterium]
MLCFETEVLRVRRVSPSFVRVTLGGDCLDDLCDGGARGPRDQRIKLIVPTGGGSTAPVADLSPGWYPRWLARDPAERGEMRTYTIRAVRHREIDVDFVLHGVSGPASAWATSARPGDRLTLLGPNRRNGAAYGGIEWAPPEPDRAPVPVLLAADETAVPAVGSILATLSAGYVGHVLLEVPGAEDFQDLFTHAELSVTWLARGDRAHGEALLDAVRQVTAAWGGGPADVDDVDPDELLWEVPAAVAAGGSPYAWVAGEAGVVRDVRRHLVGEVGLPRDSVAFMGYWRLGKTAG